MVQAQKLLAFSPHFFPSSSCPSLSRNSYTFAVLLLDRVISIRKQVSVSLMHGTSDNCKSEGNYFQQNFATNTFKLFMSTYRTLWNHSASYLKRLAYLLRELTPHFARSTDQCQKIRNVLVVF